MYHEPSGVGISTNDSAKLSGFVLPSTASFPVTKTTMPLASVGWQSVVVVACCSVECDLAPATRVLPLQGYVLAATGGTTQLTWVREADVADASALHAVLAANDARIDRLVARCVSPEASE